LDAVPGYEILGVLGRGAMGVVYKARHERLNRVVALKMVRRGEFAGSEELLRFLAEAEAVARLQHPHIVQLFECGRHNGLPFFTLECIDGGSLASRLKETPLPPREAARVVEALARGIHCAHQHGIVHRDLKPANVLLASETPASGAREAPDETRSGGSRPPLAGMIPKITDFGLAKRVEAGPGLTLTGVILGTPSYMAPEQARGESKTVGPAADVYALGAILYECLTGRPPFKGPSSIDTLLQVLDDEPVPPTRMQPKTPGDLETICLKCLYKEPAKRYATAAELADDLRRFQAGEPILARPVRGWERAVKWARRRPAPAALAALCALLLLGLPALGLWYARHEGQRAEEAEAQRKEADEQRTEAGRERDRALKAERESYVQAAELAMQRGAWKTALPYLDKALSAGHADPIGLRLAKVRAWCALNEVPQAVQELQALEGQAGLTDRQKALVLLWQGDMAISLSAVHEAEGLLKVRQSLSHGLPPAEDAYARGLLADSSPEAVGYFQQALQADPFHPRANGACAMCLFTLGRVAEARDQVHFAERVFPEDPTFQVLHAMLLALGGKKEEAKKHVERAGAVLKDRGQVEMARTLVEFMDQGVYQSEGVLAGEESFARWLFRNGPGLAKIMLVAQGDRGKLGTPSKSPLLLPMPPTVFRALRALPASPQALRGGNPDQLSKTLAEAVRVHPEGILFHLYGIALAEQQRWSEAETAFLKAGDTPSIFPVRRAALFLAVAMEQIQSREAEPELRQKLRQRALQNTRKLVELSPLFPSHALELSQLAISMNELDLARRIIADWERQKPGDVNVQRRRMVVEYNGEAYGLALKAANKVLDRQPKDAEALAIRKAALEKLGARDDSGAVPYPRLKPHLFGSRLQPSSVHAPASRGSNWPLLADH
jgi:tetratricopeptide (TPR) repeat protein